MKLKILSAIAVMGITTGVFGQGVILDNTGNSGSISATNGGLVYENGTVFNGSLYDLGVTVLGGTSVGTESSLGTFTPADDSKGYTGVANGEFQLGPAFLSVNVPGVAGGGLATITLQIWDYDSPLSTGVFQSYAAAVAGGDYVGTVTFVNAVSNPGGSPPVPAPDLTGMSSVNLLISSVPEPTTIALAGLGIASLLAFRRRK